MFKIASLMLMLGLFLFGPTVFAEAIGVPAYIQATMIGKLVKGNTKLSSKQNLKILVVYTNKTEYQKNLLCSEMKNKAQIKSGYASEVEAESKGCDVVFFMPGSEDAASICKHSKILSMSASVKAVQSGLVSIAIASENDKPRVFVNLSSLKAEEQTFNTDILRIARVFK